MGITERLLRKTVETKARQLRSASQSVKQSVGFIVTHSFKESKNYHNSALKQIKLDDIDSVFLALTVGLALANGCLVLEIILFCLIYK